MTSSNALPAITFYDLDHTLHPSSRSWSPATTRISLALQHRRFPYTRVAVSYPDIAALLASKGVAPAADDDDTPFTLPAITLHYADGTEKTIMDSVAIAPLLDSLAPASDRHPKLFPAGAESEEHLVRVRRALNAGAPDDFRKRIVAFVPLILDERGAEYFNQTRAAFFGASMVELREIFEGDDLRAQATAALEPVAKLYVELKRAAGPGQEGLFLGGRSSPTYPDMVVAAVVEWYRCARGDEVFDGVMEELEGGVLARVMQALRPFLRP